MYIIFGILAGIVTGLGMGGGTVLILLLSMFARLEQHIAQATNLLFFVPTSISTIIINIKQKNLNKRLAIIVSTFGVIGAIIGSLIADNISSENLKKYFAIFIFVIALHEIYELFKTYKIEKKKA